MGRFQKLVVYNAVCVKIIIISTSEGKMTVRSFGPSGGCWLGAQGDQSCFDCFLIVGQCVEVGGLHMKKYVAAVADIYLDDLFSPLLCNNI